MLIANAFEKLVKFSELVEFDIVGATIDVCDERETDTVIKLSKDGKEIDFICRNDGKFDNYSVQEV